MEQRALLFRRMIGRFTTGVAVVMIEDGSQAAGMTVNSLTSVSLDPLLLLFCARNESCSADALLRRGRFTVNLLAHWQQSVSRHFAGKPDLLCPPDSRKADGFTWLAQANAVFRCEVEATYPGGDHRIIVGRVLDMDGPENGDLPLVFHEGGYARLEQRTPESLRTKRFG